MGMGRDAEQRECACRYDCTFIFSRIIHRLRVTNSGVCLHWLQPHQFVNSVEFDSAVYSHDTCQVQLRVAN